MSTETTEIEAPVEEQVENKAIEISDFALLFELEHLAVAGRRATFDLLKSMLGEKKITLTAPSFSRYCLYSAPSQFMSDLLEFLGTKKISEDKLMEDLASGLSMFYSSKQAVLQPGVKEFIEKTIERDVPVAALSLLSEDAAESLMSKTGLHDLDIEVFAFEENGQDLCPRADTWMKMAKSMSKDPRRCVALASSAASCKAALSAGMRCLVVPDEFTSFQDFSGAEMVFDSLEDCKAGELVADLFCIQK